MREKGDEGVPRISKRRSEEEQGEVISRGSFPELRECIRAPRILMLRMIEDILFVHAFFDTTGLCNGNFIDFLDK